MSNKNATEVRPNSLVDVDESLMKKLNELPAYEASKDSKYCEVHPTNLDVWRTLGLATVITRLSGRK